MQDTVTEGTIVERVERPAPAESFARMLMEALRDPKLKTADKQMLLNMRKEVLADEAREAFHAAFAAFSAELPQVERDGTVTLEKDGKVLGRYSFTTIEGMDLILRPLLAKHGFAISFSSHDDKEGVVVTGTLGGHGWERSSTYRFPPDVGPGRNALQARGSSRRYAKRYITDDLCNVVRKGKDDDGRGAIEKVIDATQVKELLDLMNATDTNSQTFLDMMVSGAETVEDIRQRDYPRLLLALKAKASKRK